MDHNSFEFDSRRHRPWFLLGEQSSVFLHTCVGDVVRRGAEIKVWTIDHLLVLNKVGMRFEKLISSSGFRYGILGTQRWPLQLLRRIILILIHIDHKTLVYINSVRVQVSHSHLWLSHRYGLKFVIPFDHGAVICWQVILVSHSLNWGLLPLKFILYSDFILTIFYFFQWRHQMLIFWSGTLLAALLALTPAPTGVLKVLDPVQIHVWWVKLVKMANMLLELLQRPFCLFHSFIQISWFCMDFFEFDQPSLLLLHRCRNIIQIENFIL